MRLCRQCFVVLGAGLLFMLGSLPGRVGAATSGIELGVSPTIGAIDTVPGRTVIETLTLVNLSDNDLTVVARVTDLATNSDGDFSNVPSGSGLASASAWIIVEPAGFVIAHGHTQIVRVAVTPPVDTPARGYYAAVVLASAHTAGRSSITETLHPILLALLRNGSWPSGRSAARAIGALAR